MWAYDNEQNIITSNDDGSFVYSANQKGKICSFKIETKKIVEIYSYNHDEHIWSYMDINLII